MRCDKLLLLAAAAAVAPVPFAFPLTFSATAFSRLNAMQKQRLPQHPYQYQHQKRQCQILNLKAPTHVMIMSRHQHWSSSTMSTMSLSLSMYPHQKEFERAIECACEPGLCKDDELYQLAQLLESYDKDDDETKYEDQEEDEDRKQERVDRQDVADILRADAALQLRLVYLNEVNIFKERVEEIIKKKNKNNNNDDDDRDKGSSMTWHTMIRAVECASQRGLCKDSRELNRLADALEAYKGCLVEEDCDQEQIDRQDVVDILRMQSSLQLRQVYLKDVNIFKERVDQAASSSDASPSEDDLP